MEMSKEYFLLSSQLGFFLIKGGVRSKGDRRSSTMAVGCGFSIGNLLISVFRAPFPMRDYPPLYRRLMLLPSSFLLEISSFSLLCLPLRKHLGAPFDRAAIKCHYDFVGPVSNTVVLHEGTCRATRSSNWYVVVPHECFVSCDIVFQLVRRRTTRVLRVVRHRLPTEEPMGLRRTTRRRGYVCVNSKAGSILSHDSVLLRECISVVNCASFLRRLYSRFLPFLRLFRRGRGRFALLVLMSSRGDESPPSTSGRGYDDPIDLSYDSWGESEAASAEVTVASYDTVTVSFAGTSRVADDIPWGFH
ncbi:hypothetical protein ACOSP7_032790 [Xanthoceras sorbifolium]